MADLFLVIQKLIKLMFFNIYQTISLNPGNYSFNRLRLWRSFTGSIMALSRVAFRFTIDLLI
jgi:hypothetical protein